MPILALMDFKWETAKPAQPKGSHMDSEDGIIFLFYALTGVILTPTSCLIKSF